MKKLLCSLVLSILPISCVSSARTWHVSNVDNVVRKEVIAATMVYLEKMWERWPISFSINAVGTDGLIEINFISKGNTIGTAAPGMKKLRGPHFGVFYKFMHENGRFMTDKQQGEWLALVISHEVAHTYGVYIHNEHANCIMNATVPRSNGVWCGKTIKHLDRVLGLKQNK